MSRFKKLLVCLALVAGSAGIYFIASREPAPTVDDFDEFLEWVAERQSKIENSRDATDIVRQIERTHDALQPLVGKMIRWKLKVRSITASEIILVEDYHLSMHGYLVRIVARAPRTLSITDDNREIVATLKPMGDVVVSARIGDVVAQHAQGSSMIRYVDALVVITLTGVRLEPPS